LEEEAAEAREKADIEERLSRSKAFRSRGWRI
jgi:hypothetical protein